MPNCSPVVDGSERTASQCIRVALRRDLLQPIEQHKALVAAIDVARTAILTDVELEAIQTHLSCVIESRSDSRLAGQSSPIQASCIYLVRQCDQDFKNPLNRFWDVLTPAQRITIKNGVFGHLLVLRERAAKAHNRTPSELEDHIDCAVDKLEVLPDAIQLSLTKAIVSRRLNCSAMTLINKYSMLVEEMPDLEEAELVRGLVR